MELHGLTAKEVELRRAKFGANALPEEKPHLIRRFLGRFWTPIPWLLEGTIIAQLFLGEYLEAGIIAALLFLNAALGVVQEGRAQRALALLRRQLSVRARVRRDGIWQDLAAEELVPDDVIQLGQGMIVPADVQVEEGSLLVDQSSLTGESVAVPVRMGATAYASSVVHGGEATARVQATGAHTFFGRTAELVHIASPANRQEHEIVAVVRNLFVVNAALLLVVLGAAHLEGMSLASVIPLALTVLLASIPVALPAMFTLAAALGALELQPFGVLVTRLTALPDVASMTVLCSDKTGTLTRNEATVSALHPAAGFSEDELLRAAALASDPSGRDPVDQAVVSAAARKGISIGAGTSEAGKPFDAVTKYAEATYREAGEVRRYVKGAPAVVASLSGVPESAWLAQEAEMARQGQRVLAVGEDGREQLRFAGLIGLADAVRESARAMVSAIEDSGVRVVMVTGDNPTTARAVAGQVGIPPTVCPTEYLRTREGAAVVDCSVFASVFPEDKFRLVKILQRQGAVVGMSGDGVNDAPALRQADVGVAVANATDVAKASAAIVLTRRGLGDIVPAIQTGRRVFQRIMTYTLNMLIKKIEIMALLVIGFLLTRQMPLTPLLMVLFIFLNDFLTMSISTDCMSISNRPNAWNTRRIVLAGALLAFGKLTFSLGVFLAGYSWLKLDTPRLQSLTFAMLVLGSQAGVYLLREREHFWASAPSRSLLWSTGLAIVVVTVMTLGGIHVAALRPGVLVSVAAAVVIYYAALDWFKIKLFATLKFR